MLDFKAISEMNVEEFFKYIDQLDDETKCLNRDILNFINGFILCKSLSEYNLPIELINRIFLAYLEGNNIKELEKIYKKS